MLSLGLHRELQIPDTFPTLVLCDDFKYDVGRSPVRCANSQRQMHEMFLAISRLCNTVTGLLQTTPDVAGSEQHRTDLSRCENELNAWFEFTSRRFPDLANSREPPEHWFVIQRSFMYTYYFAAKLTLCHRLESERMQKQDLLFEPGSSSADARAAIDGIVKHIEDPLQRGLIKYLPITV